MDQEERLDYLIASLKEDSIKYKEVPVEKSERRMMLRSLMNLRIPKPISPQFLWIQDEFLQQESTEKGIVSWRDIPHIGEQFKSQYESAEKISLWQGDITRLQVDAIVNAANSQMLGCFVPCHRCIDNAIHSAAGIELREECYQYMNKKREHVSNYEEPTGSAVVTKGYNLPCKYIIHTVGPIVHRKVSDPLRADLRSCYQACLAAAMEHGIRTIAFCCISTGEFRFPNKEAAKITWKAIQDCLKGHHDKFDRIIINVFKECDYDIYQELLSNEGGVTLLTQ